MRFFGRRIPTKKYIRAFIVAQLGPKPVICNRDVIGNKLYDVLQHSTNAYKTDFSTKHYDAKLRVYVSLHTFKSRGANLNETNVKNFNAFLQALIKDKMRFLLDLYVPMFGSFEKALAITREVIKIEDEDWDSDSIKKDYYRYRIKKNLPLLYKKERSKN
jgi:hypothetical protein